MLNPSVLPCVACTARFGGPSDLGARQAELPPPTPLPAPRTVWLFWPCRDSKVLPLFVQYLKSGKEDEGDKKQALMAELQHINDFLAQPGKVREGSGGGTRRAGMLGGQGKGGLGRRGVHWRGSGLGDKVGGVERDLGHRLGC